MDPITSVVTAVGLGASAGLTDTATAAVTDAAAAWNNLGLALRAVRRFEEAITAYERDIAICAQLGDRYGQAQTLENRGLLHAELKHPERACSAWANAMALYTAAGAEEAAARVRQRIVDLDR